MFCHKCGFQLNDGSLFCTNCGTNLSRNAESVAVNTASENENKSSVRKDDAANNVFVWGIIALACAFFFPYLGFIFSIVALVKAKKYRLLHGALHGKAKTGKTMAWVGLIIGILYSLLITACLIFGILCLLASIGFAIAPLAFLFDVAEMTGMANSLI